MTTTDNQRLLDRAIHGENYKERVDARVRVVELLNERERLREALRLAAERMDYLTNWVENSYGGINEDVRLGRSYASEARAALNEQKGGEG